MALSSVFLLNHVYLASVYNFATTLPVEEKDKKVMLVTKDNFVGVDQEETGLANFIRHTHIVPPSPLPYVLEEPNRIDFSQFKQSAIANNTFLKGMRGGVFLEAGAFTGEKLSNTLYFEKYLGWTGLLVEPDPELYSQLLSHHRKAYSINSGLSLTTKADVLRFKPNGYLGRMGSDKGTIEVNVFPLYSLLRALNYTTVDYFSLDIEGDEMKVLQTIPWDKVKFRLITIEVNHVAGGTKGILNFLESKGYTFLGVKMIDAWFGLRELLVQSQMDVDQYLKKNQIVMERKKILRHK
ncbi:hypothetical protein Pmani_008214 [Petrolisthes manimaculis]|uniref:Methyltransferase FkbM domain-containing protein n=1 Tax=Petrolisthes manimaculis TaxID=1843537 RepID=A0AAE1UJ80_9EUCA|nr:hypothetical protein Pmani_008214 [Petrolisthes manimaculis]